MSWKKADIINHLVHHNIPCPCDVVSYQKLTKPSLIQLAKTKPVKPKFMIEELVENQAKDIKILWTPAGHCEFNSIDMMGGEMGGFNGVGGMM